METADVRCTKCGEIAHTKCPAQRNVFPEDQVACAYGYLLDVEQETEDYPEGSMGWNAGDKKKATVITARILKHATDDEIVDFLKRIGALSSETLKKAICDHSWEWVGNQDCLFGCHKAKKAKVRSGKP